METARSARLSDKGLEELYETLGTFGVTTSRQIFAEAAHDIKSIVASNSAMKAAGAAEKLQKAAARLALFGVYGPRTMVRDVGTARAEAGRVDLCPKARAALLKSLHAAEGEVEALMGEYANLMGAESGRSGNALTAVFWPAVLSYGGAGCGIALTHSVTGALLGLFLGTLIWFFGLLALHRG